jgi:hypothetical protein
MPEHELMKDQMELTAIEREQRSAAPRPVIKLRPSANDRQFAVQLRLDIA